MGGGSDVSFPGPSQTEQDLMKEQLDTLRTTKQEIEGFKPFVLQQYGLQSAAAGSKAEDAKIMQSSIDHWQRALDTGKLDNGYELNEADKNYYGQRLRQDQQTLTKLNNTFEYTPEQQARNTQLKALQDQALELQKAQGDRQKLALQGKLPLSQQLIQQRDKDFSALKEDQLKAGNEIIGDSFDNAVAKTTSGQQALESLKKTYSLAADAETNAVINQAQLPGVYASLYSGSSANANPGAPGSSYAGLMPLYGQALQPYQMQRQGQFQADQFNANASNSFQNTLLTGLLNGAAYAGGSYAGAGKSKPGN
jgi:hypothetical protein